MHQCRKAEWNRRIFNQATKSTKLGTCQATIAIQSTEDGSRSRGYTQEQSLKHKENTRMSGTGQITLARKHKDRRQDEHKDPNDQTSSKEGGQVRRQ